MGPHQKFISLTKVGKKSYSGLVIDNLAITLFILNSIHRCFHILHSNNGSRGAWRRKRSTSYDVSLGLILMSDVDESVSLRVSSSPWLTYLYVLTVTHWSCDYGIAPLQLLEMDNELKVRSALRVPPISRSMLDCWTAGLLDYSSGLAVTLLCGNVLGVPRY